MVAIVYLPELAEDEVNTTITRKFCVDKIITLSREKNEGYKPSGLGGRSLLWSVSQTNFMEFTKLLNSTTLLLKHV